MEAVRLAAERGLAALALTDHDTTAGVPRVGRARAAADFFRQPRFGRSAPLRYHSTHVPDHRGP